MVGAVTCNRQHRKDEAARGELNRNKVAKPFEENPVHNVNAKQCVPYAIASLDLYSELAISSAVLDIEGTPSSNKNNHLLQRLDAFP